jgi:L-lactate dehydrogenase complex protein LldF
MHHLRTEQVERGLRPWTERLAFKAWAWVAGRPVLYRWLTRRAARYLNWLAGGEGRINTLGLAPGWTAGRDLPVSSGRTFHELYKARKRA